MAILLHRNVQFVKSHVISDRNGCYVIVQGKLYGIPIYALNWDNVQFFTALFSSLPDLKSHKLILGCDLNCVLNAKLDRSKQTAGTLSRSVGYINFFLQTYKILDAWRFKNPTSRKYSFFSSAHHSYSRIDYFLLDEQLIPILKSIEYETTVISDHCPVVMGISFPDNIVPQQTWRFNPHLLSNQDFVEYISNHIYLFMETNQNPQTSKGCLWETLKAYLRGIIISYTASANKESAKRLSEIETRIHAIDQEHSSTPSENLYRERISLQTEYDIIMTDRAEDLHRKSRLNYYESEERASKLLSHQLRQSAATSFIIEIGLDNGGSTTEQKIINNFKNSTKTYINQKQVITGFFNDLKMPSLDQDDINALEEPLTQAEIERAIKTSKSGKSPGPDGCPIKFYKAFSVKLVPLLCKVYEEALQRKTLPLIMTQATISVLLKKGKDPLKCDSYWPISLLCSDYKILTKTLAARLEPTMHNIIHRDQTGFMTGRQLAGNLRRLFNIIYTPNHNHTQEVLISLDAHKALKGWSTVIYLQLLESLVLDRNFVAG